MKRVRGPAAALILVAAACGSYGDESEHPLPNRSSSSSGDLDAGATTSSSGSTGAPVDAGDAAGPPFCKTAAAKDAIHCLDFDDLPKRPFGFDQVFGNDDSAHLVPSPNGTTAFFASSKALGVYGVFDSLPQDSAPLTIAFDAAVQSTTGTPMIAGVIGAGTNCPGNQGSLGILASVANDQVTFTVTNVTNVLGTAKVGELVHFVLQSDKRPGPGKTITTVVTMNGGNGLAIPAKLPIGCQNFSAGFGSTGVFNNGTATATFDDVLVK